MSRTTDKVMKRYISPLTAVAIIICFVILIVFVYSKFNKRKFDVEPTPQLKSFQEEVNRAVVAKGSSKAGVTTPPSSRRMRGRTK